MGEPILNIPSHSHNGESGGQSVVAVIQAIVNKMVCGRSVQPSHNGESGGQSVVAVEVRREILSLKITQRSSVGLLFNFCELRLELGPQLISSRQLENTVSPGD